MAKRHLAILNECTSHPMTMEGFRDELEVEDPSLILDELIDHVTLVQDDNSLLGQFAELYCLTKGESNESK